MTRGLLSFIIVHFCWYAISTLREHSTVACVSAVIWPQMQQEFSKWTIKESWSAVFYYYMYYTTHLFGFDRKFSLNCGFLCSPGSL